MSCVCVYKYLNSHTHTQDPKHLNVDHANILLRAGTEPATRGREVERSSTASACHVGPVVERLAAMLYDMSSMPG